MAPRTHEQVEAQRLKEEVVSLRAQLAFLGGAVCAAIDTKQLDRLAEIADSLPFLNSLTSFRLHRGKPDLASGEVGKGVD